MTYLNYYIYIYIYIYTHTYIYIYMRYLRAIKIIEIEKRMVGARTWGKAKLGVTV